MFLQSPPQYRTLLQDLQGIGNVDTLEKQWSQCVWLCWGLRRAATGCSSRTTVPGSMSLVATPYLPRTSSYRRSMASEKAGSLGFESWSLLFNNGSLSEVTALLMVIDIFCFWFSRFCIIFCFSASLHFENSRNFKASLKLFSASLTLPVFAKHFAFLSISLYLNMHDYLM